MLVELRIANFRSLCEEQTFSLVATKDTKHPENLIPCEGYKLLKAAAIYGANASGKSNLIKAIHFMARFISDSATRMNEEDEIPEAIPFRLSLQTYHRPCSFEVTFIEESIRYQYGFTTTRHRVHDEWLSSFSSQGEKLVWFERRFHPETQTVSWRFDGPLKKHRRLLQSRTRHNSLVLSTGPRENIEPLKAVYRWFRRKLWIFDLSQESSWLQVGTAKNCQEDAGMKARVVRLLRDADFQIDDLSIAEESFAFPEVPSRNLSNSDLDSALQSLISAIKETAVDMKRPKVRTLHRLVDSEDFVPFDLEEESHGTQRFFALAGPFLAALDKGAVVFIDELECSLHPLLTRKFVELFQSPTVNNRGAQLIFATHDSTLLDPELFRRDQIYLVEKNRNQASEYFSLYDFDTKDRPRNTEAFQRNYLAGRYGAVPQFGPIFEELELK